MAYSINIDWQEEFTNNPDKWQNEGQRLAKEIIEDKKHIHYKEMKKYLGIDKDTKYPEDVIYENFEPMMNYVYPLEIHPEDEKIYSVIMQTNLTIMYNNDTDEYFLVLTGGGMDLSQDIALAYILCERWIPYDLLRNVSTQKGLSVSGKNWEKLRTEMIYQFNNLVEEGKQYKKRWEETTN